VKRLPAVKLPEVPVTVLGYCPFAVADGAKMTRVVPVAEQNHVNFRSLMFVCAEFDRI
jgi:hypothetical protein